MLCIASAGALTALMATGFSLSWTHSVELTQWREEWRVVGDRLALVQASVEGAGAGIAMPPDAVWADGRWTYVPRLAPLARLDLAASGATASPWTLCPTAGQCLTLGADPGAAIRVWAAPECSGATRP